MSKRAVPRRDITKTKGTREVGVPNTSTSLIRRGVTNTTHKEEKTHRATTWSHVPKIIMAAEASAVSRCFICLGDAGEEGDISDWVHPCPCSLEAHHACLLQWVDECERESKPLKCPVCQAPIRVEGAKDLAVELSDAIRNFVNGVSPIAIGSMFGGAVMAGQALYGFHAIRIFAGEEAVLNILGTGTKPHRTAPPDDGGMGGGLREIINNLADNLGGGEDLQANERVEVWFDEGADGNEAELIIDIIEEVTDDEEGDAEEGMPRDEGEWVSDEDEPAAEEEREGEPSTTPNQRLALAICDFLTKSLSDGTLPADDRDSIDVAINCIAESFKVDPAAASAADEPLLQIYTAYESTRGASAPEPTEEQKKEGETLKSRGNAAMAAKDYAKAIDLYTQALDLHPATPARADAEAAVAIDPTYTKAWSRLGLASDAMKKGYETAKRRVDEVEGGDANLSPGTGPPRCCLPAGGPGGMPDLSSLASMFGGGAGAGAGAGGAGGPGGMDFASILNNPMFQNMAQSLMNNPEMMSSLMGNPRLREMANQMGTGGGMPDISAMMNDPLSPRSVATTKVKDEGRI
ncbi:unnamed protein product [Parascedosporium putredinis]|uniref:Uncharacterized protein n=1 Tax=Parascedosporium putredinis TaxID=1442378 RepID=A0A9P1M873_9PEZI|nr:unnamed protein product [Parascedosporium putredinis]CAI7989355.1 unnamed protein product [Parascedosporium putredinis]